MDGGQAAWWSGLPPEERLLAGEAECQPLVPLQRWAAGAAAGGRAWEMARDVCLQAEGDSSASRRCACTWLGFPRVLVAAPKQKHFLALSTSGDKQVVAYSN